MHTIDFLAELLESRLLLAGNVTARVTGAGDLVVRGDARDNQVTIVPGESEGQFLVIGNDTTINREAGPYLAEGVTRNMRVILRGGHDVLNVGPGSGTAAPVQFDGRLFVNAGAGNDRISVTGSGNVAALNEGGSAFALGTVYVRGQAGDDVVAIQDLTMSGDLRVFDTVGSEEVLISNIDMNGENCEVDVATCPGEDEICFEGQFTGMDVRVRAGAHVDTLRGVENLPENARISGVELYGSHDQPETSPA